MSESFHLQKIEDQEHLIQAVSTKDHGKVRTLLKSSNIDVNLPRQNMLDDSVHGPILLLAIQNGNSEMIKILVKEFGAKLNELVIVEEKPTNLLIIAMNFCLSKFLIPLKVTFSIKFLCARSHFFIYNIFDNTPHPIFF